MHNNFPMVEISEMLNINSTKTPVVCYLREPVWCYVSGRMCKDLSP